MALRTVAPFKLKGHTGATAASRYMGATASGAPASGAYLVGDFVIDQTGYVWVCTGAGTPGTWVISGLRKWWKDLDLLACMYPDGSGTGNNPGRLAMTTSSASQTTNAPKAVIPYISLGPTTDESIMWMFRLPQGYVAGSAATLYFAHNEASGSNNVVWKAAVAHYDDGDSFQLAFATVQTLTVASVANPTLETSAFTLTMTGINGGEYLWVMLGRDADNGSDTQTGDAYLLGAGFECQVA